MACSEDDLRLISRYLDGILSPEELSELETQLSQNADFADQFARSAMTHRQVSELLTENKLHSLLDKAVGISPLLPRELQAGTSTGPPKNYGLFKRVQHRSDSNSLWPLVTRTLIGLAIAALVFIAIFPSKQEDLNTEDASQLATSSAMEEDEDTEQSIAATVTRLSKYRAAQGTEPLQIGDQIETGSLLAFDSGIVKLTFGCGAEVTLQGPCEFLLENSMLGFLKKGSVTATVPRRAFTFAVRAPGVDFIDLGTDFGISVDSAGRSELHVFEGEVIYRQDIDTLKSADVVHVTQDEAFRFNSTSEEPSQITMDRKLFGEHFDLRGRYQEEFELPISRELALWLAADQGVITDDDSYALSWYDQSFLDNRSAEDAFQPDSTARPKLIRDAINGMPGLRFDGQNDHMFTTSLETTDNQTVMIVCQFTEQSFSEDRIYGAQILNYDGPPTRELTSTLAPGVLQIGEPLLDEEFQPSLITAQVFAGFVGNTTVEAGRTDAKPVGANTPVIITYRYDYENGTARLMLNGRVVDEARAFAPAGLTSRKVIGRHAWMELFFGGDLSELLIYNCALAPDELRAMTNQLAEKYSIALEDADASLAQ